MGLYWDCLVYSDDIPVPSAWNVVFTHHLVVPSAPVWFGLCCLMTPGLSKDIRCHV